MRSTFLAAVTLAALLFAAATLVAHETTYMGTIESIEKAGFSVRTVDAKGKVADKATWFTVTNATRITRGDKPVTWADVRLTRGERVVVIVSHGDEGDDARPARASQVRLAAR